MMQTMSITNIPNATSPATCANGEPKFFHYCYVCNTQLNSCKQAMLHCNGKRHRKKLQFVQARKAPGAPLQQPVYASQPTSSTNAVPNTNTPTLYYNGGSLPSTGQAPPMMPPPAGPAPYAFHHAPSNTQPPMQPEQTYFPVPCSAPTEGAWVLPPNNQFVPLPAPPGHPHPHVPQTNTQHALYPRPLSIQARPHMNMMPPAPLSGAFANMWPSMYGQASSSPLYTDSSGGLRSAVISPSETSSMSSDPSQPGHGRSRLPMHMMNGYGAYRCAVCLQQFPTGALLHQHLQLTKHFQPHNHNFDIGSEAPVVVKKVGDCSETESSHSNGLHYCSVCSIAVNSQTQLHSHNNGQKHRQRINTRHSRSSSTSSEPVREVTAESGYTSGSGGDDVLRALNDKDGQVQCVPCNMLFESRSQAQKHLQSARHTSRATSSGRPPFRRKGTGNSFRRSKLTSSNNTSVSDTKLVCVHTEPAVPSATTHTKTMAETTAKEETMPIEASISQEITIQSDKTVTPISSIPTVTV